MTLYHTSDKPIDHPEVSFSRNYLDFGKGIYMTPNKKQAEKYAKRFFKEGKPAYLNIFEFDESELEFTHKVFEAYDGRWLDYVVECRQDSPHELFDIVEGGIADDDVFNTLDLYVAGLIPRDEAINRLRKKKPNWQICFCNQQVIDMHIKHVETLELTDDAS